MLSTVSMIGLGLLVLYSDMIVILLSIVLGAGLEKSGQDYSTFPYSFLRNCHHVGIIWCFRTATRPTCKKKFHLYAYKSENNIIEI